MAIIIHCLRFVFFVKFKILITELKTDAQIVSDETCRYNTTYDPSTLRDFELCAGKMDGTSARCLGSGLKKKKKLKF